MCKLLCVLVNIYISWSHMTLNNKLLDVCLFSDHFSFTQFA